MEKTNLERERRIGRIFRIRRMSGKKTILTPIFNVSVTHSYIFLPGIILLRANVAFGTRIALRNSNRFVSDAAKSLPVPGSFNIQKKNPVSRTSSYTIRNRRIVFTS